MKKIITFITILPLAFTLSIANAAEHEDAHTVDFTGYQEHVLTDQEIDAIVHMREEEKMARDIYIVNYQRPLIQWCL